LLALRIVCGQVVPALAGGAGEVLVLAEGAVLYCTLLALVVAHEVARLTARASVLVLIPCAGEAVGELRGALVALPVVVEVVALYAVSALELSVVLSAGLAQRVIVRALRTGLHRSELIAISALSTVNRLRVGEIAVTVVTVCELVGARGA
jgi:hypothetical protein